MPTVKLTDDEFKFVEQERERIRLDNTDWNKLPTVTDRELMIMTPGVVYRVFTSRPQVWMRDDLSFRMRNVLHPDNLEWYMEQLMVMVSRGEITAEEVHAKLAILPVYDATRGHQWTSS